MANNNCMSNYLESKVLGVIKGQTFTAPTKTYVGLFLSDPTEGATGGVEVSYSGYQRVEVAEWSTPAWDAANIRTGIKNVSEATFATPATDVGTVTHLVIFDSKTGGNRLFYFALEEPMEINTGDVPVVIANEINLYMKGELSQPWQAKVLNTLNGTSITGIIPHMALYNGDAELATGNYARIEITFGEIVEQSNGTAIIKNSTELSFERASSNWGSYDKFAIMSASSGSDVVWAKTTEQKTVQRLTMIRFDVDGLTVGVN